MRIAIGDLNGDRKLDLVSANGTSGSGDRCLWLDSVSVLRQQGRRQRFDPSVTIGSSADDVSAPLQFNSVAIRDLNGDRRPDIVTADGHRWTISVLINKGGGRLGARWDYGPLDEDAGLGAEVVALGDLSGDGRFDVVTAKWDYVSVFVNRPGLCTVQDVELIKFAAARRKLARAHCRVGKIRHTYGVSMTRGTGVLAEPSCWDGATQGRQGQSRRQSGAEAMTMRRQVAGCVAVLAGFMLPISADGGGAAAGLTLTAESSGIIVFESNRDGDLEIYAVNPDGTGLIQLTHNEDEDSSPRPSPNGTLIAFASVGGLTLMEPDGRGRRLLPGCFGLAAWSPDSTRLVCDADGEKLLVADVASGAVTTLAESGRHASWSPDGRTVAFVDGQRLYVIPAGGGEPRRVGLRRVVDWETPSWSPDSRRLAYSVCRRGRQDLFTVAANGSGNRRLARAADSPQWSPSGSRIAFAKWLPHEVHAVYTARTNGTGLKRVSVSRGGESSNEPTWSADGAALLYTRGRYRESQEEDVFVATLGTGRNRAVTQPFPAGGSNAEPRWMIGPRLSGREPVPHTITLPLARKRTFASPLGGVATDGSRAIPYINSESSRGGRAVVWNAGARRTVRTPRLVRFERPRPCW